jgi:hypothetical protein
MATRLEHWRARSLLGKSAHVVERLGLGMAGASLGLFVAAYVARSNINLIDSGVFVLVIAYGAAAFYLGIDFPSPPEAARGLLQNLGSWGEAMDLFRAAGTFLTAITAVISVAGILFDEAAPTGSAVLLGMLWLVGASMQIVAGVVSRFRTDVSAA